MLIESIRLVNFKKFKDQTFEFNEDVNIFVGDNNAGKSTILEALEIVLNFQYRGRPFNNELSPDMFNAETVAAFRASPKTPLDLPTLVIEAYMKNVPDYRGTNNSLKKDAQGIQIKVSFDPDFTDAYNKYLASGATLTSIPVEFYQVEWMDFAWNVIKPMTKQFRALYIDPTRIHPTFGKNQYISNVLSTALRKDEEYRLSLHYRETLQSFNNTDEVTTVNRDLDSDNRITDKRLTIAANTMPAGALQNALQLEVNSVPYHMIGKGEQSKVQIKLALHNKSKDIDLIMMEEPENHLSHVELSKLVQDIEDQRDGKQLFLTTHSSYVLNKLSINKICLLHDAYKRLHLLDKKVVKTLKRLPGYDTLRVALSKKVVLVEGPSDELILKKIYKDTHNGRLPEQDGIDIIVVRGVGFKTFISIGKEIGTAINVLRDNDGDYEKNVVEVRKEYADYPNIKLVSSMKEEEFSLEPAMISANSATEKELKEFAEIVLSSETFKLFAAEPTFAEKLKFIMEWFRSRDGDGKGKKKVDSAIRIFETDKPFKYPLFLDEVLKFA
ncbi:ATP-dependent endonuclease [Pseudomonas aeruginosa]|uniref:ATP-dependent nuclease n=1 Tax=Pseudomonas aeruginosa TaxID=287 RepID=UPI000F617795|nr:AAA family ATPase [Pseudomonas aeruginosa]RRI84152.1 ATP-dependent endonuclease [Pseudomonas aeruginosa]RUB84760.1 ATP-dependent endonuclease [Pseudomonas aeruginosa]HEJ4250836.1 AAA family ATPase [Pseudomonas aeruginosa]HEK0575315.1 AAA family ATPase [Pseudomonas aeruginosa]